MKFQFCIFQLPWFLVITLRESADLYNTSLLYDKKYVITHTVANYKRTDLLATSGGFRDC